ncbi:MAG: type I DNA topoisomerase [bacterium JZ-2024 1]
MGKDEEKREKILIVVESPTKAKTLRSLVGRDFAIEASYGHLYDLPADRLGIHIESGFEPEYEVLKGRQRKVESLRKAGKAISTIYLATDPDREGEAIAWALAEFVFGKDGVQRIEFHEITRSAVHRALQNPRPINEHLVEAQKARRILDRLVGYLISPLLWEKAGRSSQRILSAGRVQTASLRMVVEQEKRIQEFIPTPFWTLQGIFSTEKEQRFSLFLTSLSTIPGEKPEKREKPYHFSSYAQVAQISSLLPSLNFRVEEIEEKEIPQHPPPPFTTSTLQQEASKRLGFSPQKTMRIAQSLYEGVQLDSHRREGLITYMRTDSVRIAPEALHKLKKWLEQHVPPEYVPKTFRYFRAGSQYAQEAHECIRPTSVERTPEAIASHLDADQKKLYALIWKRFVACQMPPALFKVKTVWVSGGDFLFHRSSRSLSFDGFLHIWKVQEEEETSPIPELSQGQKLLFLQHKVEKLFPQAPARFTFATLIAEMEKQGIGRPSTYAPTVELLLKRPYIRKEGKYLIPTLLGIGVTHFLVQAFPEIFDIPFTAQMEEQLDAIERGSADRLHLITEFYQKLSALLEEAKKKKVSIQWSMETDRKCPKCGASLILRESAQGRFLGCSSYPNCKYVAPEFLQESPFPCSQCGQNLLYRNVKGSLMLTCHCEEDKHQWITPQKVTPAGKCPLCSSPLKLKPSQYRGTFICVCTRKGCDFTSTYLPSAKYCPHCHSTLFYFSENTRICCKTECEYGAEKENTGNWWRLGGM